MTAGPFGAQGPGSLTGADFVDEMAAAFRRAAGVCEPRVTEIRLGSSRAHLVCAGPALNDAFGIAFEHLAAAPPHSGPTGDALTVNLWDSVSTGVQPPAPPWSEREFQARGEISHDFGDEVRLSFRIDSGVLSVFVPATNTAFCWVRDPEGLPPWEIAAPLRPILAWWAENTGRQLVHAAAVGLEEGAVLLGARGGSGKSTTALACLEDGMLYLGDDYVLLEPGDPCRVSSLYSTAKLIPANLDDRLPRLRTFVTGRHDAEQDKVTLSLFGAFSHQLVPSLPLRAILVPSVPESGTLAIRPTKAAVVLAALAPTTLFQLPNLGAKALARLGEFVASTPRYTLELDRSLDRNVAVIRALIERGGLP